MSAACPGISSGLAKYPSREIGGFCSTAWLEPRGCKYGLDFQPSFRYTPKCNLKEQEGQNDRKGPREQASETGVTARAYAAAITKARHKSLDFARYAITNDNVLMHPDGPISIYSLTMLEVEAYLDA